jgi:hypothetical protein
MAPCATGMFFEILTCAPQWNAFSVFHKIKENDTKIEKFKI